MSTPVLDRAETYLNAQWRGSSSPWPPKSQNLYTYVTVSRQSGSGGTSFARALARLLNGEAPAGVLWTVFNGNLITHMLEANHLPLHLARYLPEDKVSEINASIGELVGLHPSLWVLIQKLNATIRELAQHNHVIIVGRGAKFATRDLAGGVHIRLVAPADYRAKHLAQLYDISERDAMTLNAKRDAGRRRYVKTTFNADIDDPRSYDLVLNTAEIPIPEAANIAASLVKARHRESS